MCALRWVILICAVVGACVPATPALPSQGGPAWVELSSPHFTMWTDSEPEKAAELLHAMEDIRQLMHAISKFPESDTKAFVVAFRNRKELTAFVPRKFAAQALSAGNALGQPVIMLSAESFELDRLVVTHEIAHVVSYSAVASQPSWFAEGLATYFETLKLHEDRTTAQLGSPLPHTIAPLLDGQRLSAAEMFRCSPEVCQASRFYPTSWLAYIYLVEMEPARLGEYMQRLAGLPFKQQDEAWTDVFPELTPEALDRALATWLREGSYAVRSFAVKLPDVAVTQRSLRDADVHAVRGFVRYQLTPTGPLPPEITAALAIDPTHLVARLVHLAHTNKVELATARAVAKAHPRDWRAWLIVMAATEGPERAEARARACILAAKDSVSMLSEACPPSL